MELRSAGKRTAAIALLCAHLCGCAPLPTAPEVPASRARGTPPAAVIQEVLEPLEPLLPVGGPGFVPVLPVDPDTLIRAEDIDGGNGGRVDAGYIEVEVPAGAYQGMAQVRITVPDDDSLRCHLNIYPESKNSFVEPVKVTFDLSSFQTDPLSVPGVFWFNEERGVWIQIAADHDAERKEIRAELSHFSQYKVAKASWNKASW